MTRYALFCAAALILLAGCSTQPDVEGKWKNGDGNLIRFDAEDKAWLGQEGYPDEGECRYRMSGDTIVVSTKPEGADSLYNSYRMLLTYDTLRIVVFGLHAGGVEQLVPVEEFAKRSGKPLDKLAFVKMKEDS